MIAPAVRHRPVLVLTHVPGFRGMIRRMLERIGYGPVHFGADVASVEPLCAVLAPELLVIDHRRDDAAVLALLARLRSGADEQALTPVLFISPDPDPVLPLVLEEAGADDVLLRPFTLGELRARVEPLMRLRTHWSAVDRAARELRLLAGGAEPAALALAQAADAFSQGHPARVGLIAGVIARQLGLPRAQVDALVAAAPFHDIGKIGIADSVLRKEGPLTPVERAMTRRHALLGARLLAGLPSPMLALGAQIALSHHERWDGCGYPHRLDGERIPLPARIVAVADVLDALTHDRSYKRAWSLPHALQQITRSAGTQFDPAVVAALLRLASERPSLLLDVVGAAEPSVEERQTQLDTAITARAQLQRLRFVQDVIGGASVA